PAEDPGHEREAGASELGGHEAGRAEDPRAEHDARDDSEAVVGPQPLLELDHRELRGYSLTTTPPFITKRTRCSSVTSWSGSPAGPGLPASTAPSSGCSSSAAATVVADWIACIGVIP